MPVTGPVPHGSQHGQRVCLAKLVTEVTVDGQRQVKRGGRAGAVCCPVLYGRQQIERTGAAELVTEVTVDGQRQVKRGGGTPMVARQALGFAEMMTGAGLARPVTEVTVDAERLPDDRDRAIMVARQVTDDAEIGQGPRLAGAVAAVSCGGCGSGVQRAGLRPGAIDLEVSGDRRGEAGHLGVLPVQSGLLDAGKQARVLGSEPFPRLLPALQAGHGRRRCPRCDRGPGACGPRITHQDRASDRGGVLVVVEQPRDRLDGLRRTGGAADEFPDQVMHPVPIAVSRQQAGSVQSAQEPFGLAQRQAGEGTSGVAVEASVRMQGEKPKEGLLRGRQVPEGEGDRSGGGVVYRSSASHFRLDHADEGGQALLLARSEQP
jgi:hypothetical protein